MEKLDEILELLRTATPMLQEFIKWKQDQAEQERAYQQEQTESQREFAAWLKQREKEQKQQDADTEELKKDFYGGENWEKNHLFPKNY